MFCLFFSSRVFGGIGVICLCFLELFRSAVFSPWEESAGDRDTFRSVGRGFVEFAEALGLIPNTA